jgi:hypothetical protein
MPPTAAPITPAPDDNCRVAGLNDKWQSETCPSATLFFRNIIWPEIESNLGRRYGKSATKHLQRGFTYAITIFTINLTRATFYGDCHEFVSSNLSYPRGHREPSHRLFFYPGPVIAISSIDWDQLSWLLPEGGSRVQSPKRCYEIKNRKAGNFQKLNNCTKTFQRFLL